MYSCTRPLVYRALGQLREAGLVEERGTAASDAGPARTTLARDAARSRGVQEAGATRRSSTSATCGRSSCSSCCSTSAPAPIRHRSFAQQDAVLIRGELALELQLRAAAEFDRTLVLWRLSVVRAALSFVEALLDQRTVEPVVYRPIGVVASPTRRPRRHAAPADRRRGGPSRIEVFEPHRGCLDDLDGFSHLWVLAHLHETTGWDPAVATFLDDRTHGTFATRSPRRPNPIGLSLARIVAVEELAVVIAGIDLLAGTPVLDLKPYVPLFDAPDEADVKAGWFEGRAERVFERRSDDRFIPRSRR